MGLKGAASYFQRMMASKVLAGMLYSIVELYLDDILVYASDESEFIVRLRSVFERFRQYNITLDPKSVVLAWKRWNLSGTFSSLMGCASQRRNEKRCSIFPSQRSKST